MNIDIHTLHDANNYGSLCQAVATRLVFARYGRARLVNYRNRHVSRHLRTVRTGLSPRDMLRTGKDLLRLSSRKRAMARFRDFLAQHGNLTPPLYDGVDVARATRDADVLVAGSDQIWNPPCVTGFDHFDPVYLLAMGPPRARRIAYASSRGAYRYNAMQAQRLHRHLAKFYALSVRERDTAEYFARLLDRPVETVLDPTLLLDQKEWRALASPLPELPSAYVLAYLFDKTPRAVRALDKVRRALMLPVVVLDQDLRAGVPCDWHIRDAGPAEFLSAFAGAAYVVSDSFHGACFATNFGKPLLPLARPGRSNRVETLLDTVGGRARLVYNDAQLETVRVMYDTAPHRAALARARAKSLAWIEQALASEPLARTAGGEA